MWRFFTIYQHHSVYDALTMHAFYLSVQLYLVEEVEI